MPQKMVWEKEYRDKKLVTGLAEPQKDVRRFLRFLKKDVKIDASKSVALDLGAGTGRNTNYLASLGYRVFGIEISQVALRVAKQRAEEMGVDVGYILGSMGEKYPFGNEEFDLALDITSSNSLCEEEREVYLKETHRVLKKGGYFFVKALCKDGDKNAKKLLERARSREKDTYIMPETGIIERVFSEEDFRKIYSDYFEIIQLFRKTSYTRFQGQRYKRNFWLCYLQKK